MKARIRNPTRKRIGGKVRLKSLKLFSIRLPMSYRRTSTPPRFMRSPPPTLPSVSVYSSSHAPPASKKSAPRIEKKLKPKHGKLQAEFVDERETQFVAGEPEFLAADAPARIPAEVPASSHDEPARFLAVVVEEPETGGKGAACREAEIMPVVGDHGIVVDVGVLDVRGVGQCQVEAAAVEGPLGPQRELS